MDKAQPSKVNVRSAFVVEPYYGLLYLTLKLSAADFSHFSDIMVTGSLSPTKVYPTKSTLGLLSSVLKLSCDV
jgi:hypothetical protein